jgi:hypothetical protein
MKNFSQTKGEALKIRVHERKHKTELAQKTPFPPEEEVNFG